MMLKIIVLLFSISCLSLAKVDPPNYNFSLDKLEVFLPGKSLSGAVKKWGKGEEVGKKGKYKIHLFYVAQLRYKFAVYVQTQDDEIKDFHARLPAYFLHDIFHQSLINRYGKQDLYFNENEHSIYIWKNKNKIRHIYSGACAITCYPIYYAAAPTKDKWRGSYKPLSEQLYFNELEQKKR